MIQMQTKLKINDNSGIKIGQCIKVYNKKIGKIGDLILLSAKTLRSKQKKTKLIKGDLFKALIIHTKYNEKNTIGNRIQFDKNCVIIINNQKEPLGTRIFGPITSKFRKQKKFKILSLSSNIL
jgi:large subunit ribosomal protein L14